MVHGGCPQTSLFPDLPVYHLLECLDCWSENISLEIFLLHSDKELVGIPSSAGSFGLVSCLSKPWEIMSIVCIGRNTFGLSEYFTQGLGIIKFDYVLVILW
jgi:hypothetical protein